MFSQRIVYETLKKGYINAQVNSIQKTLPFWTSQEPLSIDGIFGSQTENAVKRFQSEMGLTADGIVGETTGKALGLWRYVEKGFDASHWNNIHWDKITTDISFVYLKATEGYDYVDPNFKSSAIAARNIGLDVGAYHFTKFQNSPFSEASNFLNSLWGVDVSRIFLDLEHRDSELQSVVVFEWLDNFLKTITGVYDNTKVGIYTSRNYLHEMGLQGYSSLADYDLWASNWTAQPIVYPWECWNTWQYTSTGNVDFCDGYVDLNLRIIEP